MVGSGNALIPEELAVRWYRSQIDWWIAVLLMLPPFAGFAILSEALIKSEFTGVVVGAAVLAFVFAIYVGLIFPMRYRVEHNGLLIQSGLLRQRVPLDQIESVFPTRNPLSGPAMSLNRLQVKRVGRAWRPLLISPCDRDDFLKELSQQANLVLKENQWVKEDVRR